MANNQEPNDARSEEVRRLAPIVYDELRQVAERYLRRQSPGFTLRPTELVHEACVHMMRHGQEEWSSPAHFRAIATQKIWQVLVDHLKRKYAQKRGGDVRPRSDMSEEDGPPRPEAPARRRIPLDRITIQWREREVDLLDLAEALSALERESGRLHDIVMLHWFGGLTHAEVGRELCLSASTCEKDFRYALVWLKRRLETSSDAD